MENHFVTSKAARAYNISSTNQSLLKTYIPGYSTFLDSGLSTIKPIELHKLTRQVEVE